MIDRDESPCRLPSGNPHRKKCSRGWVASGIALSFAIASCVTVKRTIIATPHIPGANFVGSASCESCHETHTSGFHLATHARLNVEGARMEVGCEACHGPGSVHVDSGGGFHTIVNPKRSPTVCFQCHLDMRGRFSLPHHHALSGGELSCSDCHDSHKGPAIRQGAATLAGGNDNCLKCHAAQRGPFAFEHEALREGCVTCHDPHGSVNAKLLTERNANLCLKCHVDVRSRDVTIGGLPHQFLMTRGTCWTAGCHEAVHGSHVSSSLRF